MVMNIYKVVTYCYNKNYCLLTKNQYSIVKQACSYLKNGGFLIYVVCSLLEDEGELIIRKYLLHHKNYSKIKSGIFHPINASDGFYFSILKLLNN